MERNAPLNKITDGIIQKKVKSHTHIDKHESQGKRILFLECLLSKGLRHYLVLLLKSETLAGQWLRNLDAFALT
jgi:hypothetical protein